MRRILDYLRRRCIHVVSLNAAFIPAPALRELLASANCVSVLAPPSPPTRLTYNLGSANETYEDLDLDLANPQEYEMTGEKVNLLAQKGSAAGAWGPCVPRGAAECGVGGRGNVGSGNGAKGRRRRIAPASAPVGAAA